MAENLLHYLQWDMMQSHILLLRSHCESNKNDQRAISKMHKEIAFLEQIIELKNNIDDLMQQKEKIEDELHNTLDTDLQILYEDEIAILANSIEETTKKIETIIYQDDLNEKKSVFIEIRAGTGGQEASLFVGDLARMYTLFAQKKNLTLTVADAAYTDVGGFREIILHVEDETAFEWLQYESGVHRVQRVPTTENAGRVHTSTATVAVLPEVDEITVTIEPKDLRIDTYRASGAGGQHVNKTDSAVRITHIPTGIVVQCQDERSQHKNKARALKALQAKLFALEQDKQNQNLSQARKDMVSNADRSEKIRTYNYPQNRITDHRFNITLSQLEFIMDGALENLLTQIKEKNIQNKKLHPLLHPFTKEDDA
jgi:peptide chain release factor 1